MRNAIKLTSEAQFTALARVETERENTAITLYGFACSGAALLEAEGKPWSKGGRDAAKAYLEASGVSYDNMKRVLSRSIAMLTEGRHGYVPGLAQAALKGADSVLVHLSRNGVKSQYDVINRTSDKEGNKATNDPCNRLAALLVKLHTDKQLRKLLPRALKTAEAKASGITSQIADIIDAIAKQGALSLVATKAAPKAQAKRKTHAGAPLVLGGGSANAAKARKAVKAASNGEAVTA